MYSVFNAETGDIIGLTSHFDVAVNYAEYCGALLNVEIIVCDETCEVVYAVCDL